LALSLRLLASAELCSTGLGQGDPLGLLQDVP
jgi:hypothetical protein